MTVSYTHLTGVKFVDPEHPDDDLGRMYPLNKTYTMGVLSLIHIW